MHNERVIRFSNCGDGRGAYSRHYNVCARSIHTTAVVNRLERCRVETETEEVSAGSDGCRTEVPAIENRLV